MNWFPLDLGLVAASLSALFVLILAFREKGRDNKVSRFILFLIFLCAIAGGWSSMKGSRDILAAITGGDSFAYFAISSGMFVVIHKGEHPLYDVHARISDLEKSDRLGGDNPSYESLMAASTILDIGTLIPNHASTWGQVSLGPGDRRSFNIFFTARNGGSTQILRLARVEGHWSSATRLTRRLTRRRGSELLFEKIDADFPRNSAGEVEW